MATQLNPESLSYTLFQHTTMSKTNNDFQRTENSELFLSGLGYEFRVNSNPVEEKVT